MDEPAAVLAVPVRWIDREAAGVFTAADDPAPDVRRYAKILIGLSIPGVLIGAATLLVMLGSLLLEKRLQNWREALFMVWWFGNVGVGYFLFFQWVQFVRRRRSPLGTPGLWRVSALYMVQLMSLAVLAFCAAYGWDRSAFLNLETLAMLPAWLVFPASGFVLTLILWRRTLRP